MDIILNQVSKAYGEKKVLCNLSCTFPSGSVTAVMAPSGTGKTTLLRLLLGLEQPDSGSITGIPVRKSALFQEDRLCPNLTAAANIRMVTGKSVSSGEIQQLLTALGLWDCRNQPVSQLSGGMSRRAALARALLHGSDLLVLDEPFTGLDEDNRLLAAKAIGEYRRGRTLIFVTHRQEDLPLLQADRTVLLQSGAFCSKIDIE